MNTCNYKYRDLTYYLFQPLSAIFLSALSLGITSCTVTLPAV